MSKRKHLDDQTYFQIMERVAEENNPIWNEDRAREGYPTLSVDEDYLRILNDNAYNYRGFYDKYPESAANADSHWPDEFKTVWHPTFSTESTYSGKRSQYNPEGAVGGYWIGDNFYTPPNKPRRSLRLGGKPDKHNNNLFRNTNKAGDVWYTYQETPDSEEILLTPTNKRFSDDPTNWDYEDASGRKYSPRMTTTYNPGELREDTRGPLERMVNNYFGELKYQVNNNVPISGKYTMPAIAAAPFLAWAGEAAYPYVSAALANPYVDAGLKSAFAGHGLNHAINEGIDGWGDAAMTALELAPLGGLTRPMWNAGKEGLQYAAKAVDNTARYISPSYDLYRTIGETTPSVVPKNQWIDMGNLLNNGRYFWEGTNITDFARALRSGKNNAYYMRAPKDIDVLKLGNGKFRHEVIGNDILPSGEVKGKFVSYGEPWKEFGVGENSALYEFPVDSRRTPSLMATDWKGRPQDYSVDEVYEYMQQEKALQKELASMKPTMEDYYNIRQNLINEKYPALKRYIDTSVHHANQTVIPNEEWNFDEFLKTPFWKYSENPISGQVQKELMMRWTKAKVSDIPTIEWADATRTPQIIRRSLKSGGAIHIDPANRCKFNATKERTGKTTEELTHSKNPLTRKRAIFAQNAAKWNH